MIIDFDGRVGCGASDTFVFMEPEAARMYLASSKEKSIEDVDLGPPTESGVVKVKTGTTSLKDVELEEEYLSGCDLAVRRKNTMESGYEMSSGFSSVQSTIRQHIETLLRCSDSGAERALEFR